jgi:hypothetical protein
VAESVLSPQGDTLGTCGTILAGIYDACQCPNRN